jgi:DNA replicative helicase MCM subunit Mcm2 (Cdc46/Mcm family)
VSVRLAKHLVSLYHDDEADSAATAAATATATTATSAARSRLYGSNTSGTNTASSTSSNGVNRSSTGRAGGGPGLTSASSSLGMAAPSLGSDAYLASGVGPVPQSFLREYIAYAKRASCPGLSEQAGEALVQVSRPCIRLPLSHTSHISLICIYISI